MNKILLSIIAILLILGAVWYFWHDKTYPNPSEVLSFEDCEAAGYPVMESYPRQCRTSDGRTFAEEIKVFPTYDNATSDNIVVDMPAPGSVTGKEFTVSGKARGTWYFEASFPVKVLDKDGEVIFQGHADAKADWMTENFVPFEVLIKVPESYIGPATLVLEKDNPSGESFRDASVSIPLTIEY